MSVHTIQSRPEVAAPDVYFSRAYGRAEEESNQGTWVLLEDYQGAWQLPVVVRRMCSPAEAISPYGYSGAYAQSLSERDVERAWRTARSVLHDMGLTSMFLRRSPLVSQAPVPPDAIPVIRSHATRAVKITAPDAMWSDMESSCRRSIRKAMSAGLTASVRPATPEDVCAGSPFRELYETTMTRRQAKDFYFFTTSYYLELLDGLRGCLWLADVRDRDGVTVAASLFLRHNRLLHYHLGGSLREVRGASNLLFWSVLQRACDEDIALLHLGGGVVDGDSLYTFKKSFGGNELSFSAYGLVLDPTTYDAAVARRARELGTSSEVLARAQTFPAYRAGSVDHP